MPSPSTRVTKRYATDTRLIIRYIDIYAEGGTSFFLIRHYCLHARIRAATGRSDTVDYFNCLFRYAAAMIAPGEPRYAFSMRRGYFHAHEEQSV